MMCQGAVSEPLNAAQTRMSLTIHLGFSVFWGQRNKDMKICENKVIYVQGPRFGKLGP